MMMKDEAYNGIHKKIAGVEGEQGYAKEAGSEPPKNFGHGSASSAGVGGSIPVGDGGMDYPGGGSKKSHGGMDY